MTLLFLVLFVSSYNCCTSESYVGHMLISQVHCIFWRIEGWSRARVCAHRGIGSSGDQIHDARPVCSSFVARKPETRVRGSTVLTSQQRRWWSEEQFRFDQCGGFGLTLCFLHARFTSVCRVSSHLAITITLLASERAPASIHCVISCDFKQHFSASGRTSLNAVT